MKYSFLTEVSIVLEHSLWFFCILHHVLDYIQIYGTSLMPINETAPLSVDLWIKQVPAWFMSNANIKRASCAELAQREERTWYWFLLCWISHHFFDFLSLSTKNISLKLACTSSSMYSRTYLHPSNSHSFPHSFLRQTSFVSTSILLQQHL